MARLADTVRAVATVRAGATDTDQTADLPEVVMDPQAAMLDRSDGSVPGFTIMYIQTSLAVHPMARAGHLADRIRPTMAVQAADPAVLSIVAIQVVDHPVVDHPATATEALALTVEALALTVEALEHMVVEARVPTAAAAPAR